ncbi:hypothetical protein [Streptomyces sp. H27-C3]|nr:hypothetical protein [Streptomyces sp. H27-C3]MDJ0460646.1 hypothetical protein [Streptomyces sp. H27-C3]
MSERHDPKRCRLCARLRHPAQAAAARALPALLTVKQRRQS